MASRKEICGCRQLRAVLDNSCSEPLRLVEVGNRNDHTRDVIHTEEESKKLRDTAQDVRKALDRI